MRVVRSKMAASSWATCVLSAGFLLGILVLSCGPSGSDDDDASSTPAPGHYCKPEAVDVGSTTLSGDVTSTTWDNDVGGWVVDNEFIGQNETAATTYKVDSGDGQIVLTIRDCIPEYRDPYECSSLPTCQDDSKEYDIMIVVHVETFSDFSGSYTLVEPPTDVVGEGWVEMHWYGEQCYAKSGTVEISEGAEGEMVSGTFSYECMANTSGHLEGTFHACNCDL